MLNKAFIVAGLMLLLIHAAYADDNTEITASKFTVMVDQAEEGPGQIIIIDGNMMTVPNGQGGVWIPANALLSAKQELIRGMQELVESGDLTDPGYSELLNLLEDLEINLKDSSCYFEIPVKEAAGLSDYLDPEGDHFPPPFIEIPPPDMPDMPPVEEFFTPGETDDKAAVPHVEFKSLSITQDENGDWVVEGEGLTDDEIAMIRENLENGESPGAMSFMYEFNSDWDSMPEMFDGNGEDFFKFYKYDPENLPKGFAWPDMPGESGEWSLKEFPGLEDKIPEMFQFRPFMYQDGHSVAEVDQLMERIEKLLLEGDHSRDYSSLVDAIRVEIEDYLNSHSYVFKERDKLEEVPGEQV